MCAPLCAPYVCMYSVAEWRTAHNRQSILYVSVWLQYLMHMKAAEFDWSGMSQLNLASVAGSCGRSRYHCSGACGTMSNHIRETTVHMQCFIGFHSRP